jgi:EmrB/QacA subfamily drug resistance transporter
VTALLHPPCDAAVVVSAPAPLIRMPSCESWVLIATILGSSMVFIDGTVVNVALPALQADLHTTVVAAQWIVEAYALFLAALILVGGSLGDRYGRRRMFSFGVGLFALASVGCGLAPNATTLIIGRALQGIAGALLTPGSLAMISATFDEEGRGRAIGTWSGFTAITTALGPVLGGWLVDHASWRAVFFLNVPLALIVLAITLTRVPESRDETVSRMDWLGALLATIGLAGVTFGLIESGSRGFTDLVVLTALAVGVAALVAFVSVEARIPEPMLPLGIFRARSFLGANLLTLLVYAGLSAGFFFLPFNLIQVQGYSASAAGAAMLPFILMVFVLSRWSGGLVHRYGPKLPLTMGPILAAASTLLYALPGIGGSYWTTFFPAILLQGIGMGITVAPLSTVVMGSVDVHHAGIASGINNAVSRIAGLLAIAVMGLIVLAVFTAQLDARLAALALPSEMTAALNVQGTRLAAIEIPADLSPALAQQARVAIDEAFLAGYRVVMLIAGALMLVGGLIAALLIEGKERIHAS